MRKKECRNVITFETTTEAMAFEASARQKGIEGRLIPVPREITAGCGLSFSAPLTECGAIEKMLTEFRGAKLYKLVI